LLHRDVKPCNLLLACDGYVRLGDLGCAVQLPPGVMAAHTRTGSAAYLAPEVIAGGGYDYAVDMCVNAYYSLA
jgi:serine/threonine protein kinase